MLKHPRLLMLAACLLLVALHTDTAWSAETRVHAVQSPAWVERGGRAVPIYAGMVLRPGDTLRTGDGARVELDLAEGSRFQIGEDADIGFDAIGMRAEASGGVFDAVVDILKGAFRFTTRATSSDRRRDVRLRMPIATIGIRGTDVWGRARGGEELVVLIEGEVEVEMPDGPMKMAQPMKAMVMRDDQRSTGNIALEQLMKLADETDMRADTAMMMMEGETTLVLMSAQDRRHAEALVRRLTEGGFMAEIRETVVGGRSFNRVVVEHLADARNARMMAEELEDRFGIRGAWILP